jgi:4-amino-4-deoxy-L-arabinose transferase-like glycosyltransferase
LRKPREAPETALFSARSDDGQASEAQIWWRLSAAAVLLLGAALLTAPWHGHLDDDSQLYLVVARHIAAGEGWLDLRYLPGAYDHFREHLPFGFWPYALAIRHVGEWSVGPLAALFSLMTVAVVGIATLRLAGPAGAIVAMLALATPDTCWLYGGRLRLDPPLLFFATTAALPLLFERVRPAGWIVAVASAALAASIKGPFGLLPLPAAAFASALAYRHPQRALAGLAAVLVAATPLASFLWADHALGGGSWWHGYLEQQLYASATGRRTDGVLAWYYPFMAVLGRFWPGFVLVLVGAYRAVRAAFRSPADGPILALGLNALFLLAGLCLPARKVWNHELLAFPALALLSGAAVEPRLSAWIEARGLRLRVISAGLGLLALTMVIASIAGMGARLLPEPCPSSQDLAASLAGLAPGDPVLVVAPVIDWTTLANLAAERRVIPWPLQELPEEMSRGTSGVAGARVAMVKEPESQKRPIGPWLRVAWARGWSVRIRP